MDARIYIDAFNLKISSSRMGGIIDSHYFVNKPHVHGEYLILMFHYSKELCMTHNMLNLKLKKQIAKLSFYVTIDLSQINLLF